MIPKNNLLISLEKALDYSQRRQEIIVNNIANATTPGYKRRDISFADILKNEQNNSLSLKKGQTNHMEASIGKLSSKNIDKGRTRLDNNSVDVEVEDAEMAGNALYYQSISKILGSHLNMLEKIITQGGRT